jgi:hypothetical protein
LKDEIVKKILIKKKLKKKKKKKTPTKTMWIKFDRKKNPRRMK